MPSSTTTRDIVLFAISRKFHGHCVAGKEIGLDKPSWIRPVSAAEAGELSSDDIVCGNEAPRLLDIVQVPLLRSVPVTFQTENCLIDPKSRWKKKGYIRPEDAMTFCDAPKVLWPLDGSSGSGTNDRVVKTKADAQIKHSLYLIHPTDLIFKVVAKYGGGKKVRGRFSYKSDLYDFAVTDGVTEPKYQNKAIGDYPADRDCLLCLSLGEKPINGYCYKLIAGVIELA